MDKEAVGEDSSILVKTKPNIQLVSALGEVGQWFAWGRWKPQGSFIVEVHGRRDAGI